MPPNSQLRRSLIANLIENIFEKRRFVNEIIVAAGLSKKYHYNLKVEDLDLICNIKYAIDPKKRVMWSNDELGAFDELLDEVMPFLSGRDWRMREWTKEDTWREYYTIMGNRYSNLRAMSYTTFWKHVGDKGEKIHFVRVQKNCPICNCEF